MSTFSLPKACAILSFKVDISIRGYTSAGYVVEEGLADPTDKPDGVPAERSIPRETPIQLATAVVRAFANNVEPLASTLGRPFDPLAAILYGDEDGELDLYTCSCGVAGCAGLHEGVRVSLDDKQVHWAFPPNTYRSRLHGVHGAFAPENPQPAVISFNKAQYLGALGGLKAELVRLAQVHPHMQIAPCDGYGDPKGNAFEVVFPRCVEIATKTKAARRMYLELFGDKTDLSLVLDTPSGPFMLSPAQWRAAIYPPAYIEDASTEARAAYGAASLGLRETGGDALVFLHSLIWDQVQQQAYYALDEWAEGQEPPELPHQPGPGFMEAVTVRWERR